MKIVLSSHPSHYSCAERFATLLRRHAPRHTYHTTTQRSADVWHIISPYLSAALLFQCSRAVVTLPNLHFIRYPHLFTTFDRYLVHPLLKASIRDAATLVTLCPLAKREVVDALEIEPSRVIVSPSIISCFSGHSGDNSSPLTNEELMRVRRGYELPQSFILVMGELDTRHGQASLITTIVERNIPVDLVLVSRHTSHADEILSYARRQKIATRIHILYEVNHREIRALYSLAMGVIYTPPEGGSIEPVIEGLRSGSMMILSSTIVNREVARGAAIYVDSISSDELARALRNMLYDVSYRGQLALQSRIEAARFSEEGIAAELSSIYDSI